MRTVSSRIASALLISAAAIAAPAAASAQDWTGFYIGLNGGAGMNSVDWSKLVVPSSPSYGLPGESGIITPSQGGLEGGAQVGFNQQMGMWVWGVEASFDGADLHGTSQCLGGGSDYHATCGSRTSWMFDFTGRIGGTVGPALLYLKAGGDLSGQTTHATDVLYYGSNYGSFKPSHSTPLGYLLGVGAEVAFTDDVSGALEYDYTSTEFTAHMIPSPALALTDAGLPFQVHVLHTANMVTARLNFKID